KNIYISGGASFAPLLRDIPSNVFENDDDCSSRAKRAGAGTGNCTCAELALCHSANAHQMQPSKRRAGGAVYHTIWRMHMIYEMRSYRAMPGRMPDLIKRFD